jgi:PleD family two-component response regulator
MGKHVLAAVDDLFFAAKIRAVAEHVGVDVRFVKSTDAALEAAHAELPALIIADLHSQKCDPFVLAGRLKIDERLRAVPLIGFFSHVQTALQQRAEEAGFNRVMPRSLFTKRLPEILKNNLPG